MLQLLSTEAELFPFTTRLSSGQNAIADPLQSSVTELADLYFRGSVAYSTGPLARGPADAALDTHNLSVLAPAPNESISSMDSKIIALAMRAHARMLEMSEMMASSANRAEVVRAMEEQPPHYTQVSISNGNLVN